MVGRSVGWLVGWLVGRWDRRAPVGRFDWSVHRSVGLIGWLFFQSVLIGWLFVQSVCRSVVRVSWRLGWPRRLSSQRRERGMRNDVCMRELSTWTGALPRVLGIALSENQAAHAFSCLLMRGQSTHQSLRTLQCMAGIPDNPPPPPLSVRGKTVNLFLVRKRF